MSEVNTKAAISSGKILKNKMYTGEKTEKESWLPYIKAGSPKKRSGLILLKACIIYKTPSCSKPSKWLLEKKNNTEMAQNTGKGIFDDMKTTSQKIFSTFFCRCPY